MFVNNYVNVVLKYVFYFTLGYSDVDNTCIFFHTGKKHNSKM